MPQLLPVPVGVEVGRADEGQVDPQTAVDAATVNADEDPVRDGGPGGVFGPAVVADLVAGHRAQSFKDLHDIGFAWRGHPNSVVLFVVCKNDISPI